jgi:hypothetical protein
MVTCIAIVQYYFDEGIVSMTIAYSTQSILPGHTAVPKPTSNSGWSSSLKKGAEGDLRSLMPIKDPPESFFSKGGSF